MAPPPAVVPSVGSTAMPNAPRGWGRRVLALIRQGCGGGKESCYAPSRRITPVATHSPQHLRAKSERSIAGDQSFKTCAFIPERHGAQISHRYNINKQEIGSGGYGRVFVAEDKEIKGRFVAIKKVSALRKSRKEAFQREVAVMKDLDHPNICKLLETYDEGKSMFLVMEYCDGGELFDHIAGSSSKGLPEAATADVVRQTAGALKYAHSRGIAHRDLKPENICLCSDGNGQQLRKRKKSHVKVIDWGLSAYFGDDGEALMKSNVGSVAYAAPEVLEGKKLSDGYTCACDLWSLGVLTYVCLSGRFPFQGSNSFEQLQSMRAAEYSLSGAAWGAVSGDAKDLISSLLRKDATQRMTASEVLDHSWLRRRATNHRDFARARRVLSNVHHARSANFPASVYAALVARQMDHRSLKDLPQVFLELDLDGNGVLELSEVKRGFENIFGANSHEMRDIERTFDLLDLDGSGTIDYTEFCAAGLGERIRNEEETLRAAFKAFDIHDDNGRITRNEFAQVMANAHVDASDVEIEKVFSEFDWDGDGSLDFEEWRAWIDGVLRDSATRDAELHRSRTRHSSVSST